MKPGRGRSVWPALGLASVLFAPGVAAAGDGGAADPTDEPHLWSWALRGATWISKLDGGVGPFETSDFQLDDFEAGADVEAEWRSASGRHDIQLHYLYYNNNGKNNFLDLQVGSEFDLHGVGITYDYSWWTIEEDGFRLGLGLGISGLFPNINIQEAETGASAVFDTPIPAPQGRLAFEAPIGGNDLWGHFLFDAEFDAFYLPPVGSSEFEGFVGQFSGRFFWRPWEHIGYFAGMRYLYVGADNKKGLNLDLNLWGPLIGAELRF